MLPASDPARATGAGLLPARDTPDTRSGFLPARVVHLHPTLACNLACAHCYSSSAPQQAARLHAATWRAALPWLRAQGYEQVSLSGGEPLLHPQIAAVLRAVRASGISQTVRLFTNGLLLHTMTDEFWAALDELTISNYTSAPVKPELLAAAQAMARAFDVVLNVKPVTEFSEVMRGEREADPAQLQRTYEACWLRHRCLVVRRGKFYMCTRAAYADEFHTDLLHGAHPDDRAAALAGDGVPLSTPELGEALAYLNRSEPLNSCHFCHGGAGPLAAHTQLTKADVRAGRLRPLRVLGP